MTIGKKEMCSHRYHSLSLTKILFASTTATARTCEGDANSNRTAGVHYLMEASLLLRVWRPSSQTEKLSAGEDVAEIVEEEEEEEA